MSETENFSTLRAQMIEQQLIAREITDPLVLKAMSEIPREIFVPKAIRKDAYEDCALPIELGQTISQPYVVALMLQSLALRSSDKVLEIGTGSGYEAAILGKMARNVYSIELEPELNQAAADRLKALKINNVSLRVGDGYKGWPEQAPFEAIVVSAAPSEIPRELVAQLKVGGRLILPFGEEDQELVLIEKTESGLESEELGGVRFVPMRKSVE